MIILTPRLSYDVGQPFIVENGAGLLDSLGRRRGDRALIPKWRRSDIITMVTLVVELTGPAFFQKLPYPVVEGG